MTVSYQYDVACSTSGGFTRLLFKWKGSVYKLVYRELIWFSIAYATVSIVYRCVLTEPQKRFFEGMVTYCDTFITMIPLPFVLGFYVSFVASRWWQQFMAIPWPDKDFETVVSYCNTFINLIPLTFVLGFYVSFVASRWWQQYTAIPWPDKILHCIALYVSGSDDDHSRMLRRTLMRYLNLSLILVLRSISMAVKKRFPTLQHVVEAGFMTKIELDLYQAVPSVEFNTYWIPCTWFISLLKDARKANMITDSQGLKLIMEEFNEYRARCGLLWSYDWVSIPLVYTQVVTLATYSFFIACIVGRQYVESGDSTMAKTRVDLYVPIFTLLQFFFYMGLLKVAEALINPFGDDDEDFELNWIIDRHTKVSYLVVDSLVNKNPPLVKDAHFDDTEIVLAYTKAAMAYKKKTYRGSVAYVNVPEDQQTLVLPDIAEEDESSQDPQANPPRRSGSSFLNLLNPDKTWGQKPPHHGPRTTGGLGSQELGRLSTVSLPEDALSGMDRGGTPMTAPARPETCSAPLGYKRRGLPLPTAGTRGQPNHNRVYSAESLAGSEISDHDESPDIQRGSPGKQSPSPRTGGSRVGSPRLGSPPRRQSHSGVVTVARTPSNVSTGSEGGSLASSSGGGGGGLVRTKWKQVRKKFSRHKSHNNDVENPSELQPVGKTSKSAAAMKLETKDETPKKGAPTVKRSASSGSKQSDSKESSPRSRRRRSGRGKKTPPRQPSSESVKETDRGTDSGVPSPGASMSDLHHDYGHPFYETKCQRPAPKKPPDPGTPRARTCSLTPEQFPADRGGGRKPPTTTARSMPNLRGSGTDKGDSTGEHSEVESAPSSRSHSRTGLSTQRDEERPRLAKFDPGSRGSIHV